MPRAIPTHVQPLDFPRPDGGWKFDGSLPAPFEPTGGDAWQSNGGPFRGHPARSLPFTLDIDIADLAGKLVRLHLLGIFALFAEPADEAIGTLGASLQLVGEGSSDFRLDLLNGRHYENPSSPSHIDRSNGDGTSLRTVGSIEGMRVDLLSVDIPVSAPVGHLRFKDLGSPASFVLLDVFAVIEVQPGCPFHSRSGGIGLSEIPALIRVGDRVRFGKALNQLESSIASSRDMDESRGQALTFLALSTAAMLEMGGSRDLHLLQLQAAREFDSISDAEELARAARRLAESVTGVAFRDAAGPSSYLVDRALAIVERNFARSLTDSDVARQLGLSTSHFRFLFKESTGQPFHKYVVAVRLEKAREMLVRNDMPVSEVARAVGFAGLSHFSRAFTRRFSVSPTHLRRGLE
jgi:AraC-like DNA-binding protein